MTIRRRLTLSFLTILVLFGVNLLIYFWGNQKRSDSVHTLQRAISRQILVASIKQGLNDLQKHVALLSQIVGESAASGLGPEDTLEFQRQTEALAKQIRALDELSPGDEKIGVLTFEKAYRDLSASWRIFYENFGVRHTKAITELAVRAEPLSQRVIQQVAQIQEAEKERVEAASVNFYRVEQLTDRMAVLIFVISVLVAIVVAYRVARYLTRGLGELKQGTRLIGTGDLDHRLVIRGRDELGELAQAFNQMGDNLRSARTQLTQANQELEQRNQEVEKQRGVSESLLLNILPDQIAKELQTKGMVDPKYFEDATIMFTDFVGFTLATQKMAAEDLVYMLHDYFTSFDQIIVRYGLEKLKTIGDSYMCVAGLPVREPSHPVDTILAAFEILRAVTDRTGSVGVPELAVRIGIHTGPVIAGVVGIKKFAFDIWGESVNYASRMESSGTPNRICLSERTYSRVKDFIECEFRGTALTKEKMEVDMYFAKGILPSLLDDSNEIPPRTFQRRYRVYFQKDPPAFPVFLLEPRLSAPLSEFSPKWGGAS